MGEHYVVTFKKETLHPCCGMHLFQSLVQVNNKSWAYSHY